ncbi:MAG TPA: hypothetical protein VGH42_05555 [Verrucomicrobiae bacterium]|jgi:hypothetical protein
MIAPLAKLIEWIATRKVNFMKRVNTSTLVLAVAYAFIISAEAVANLWINHVAKGSWDFYLVAEILWVLCSIFILPMCGTTRGLVLAVIALPFLDSFVDMCAIGDPFWWGTPPRLIQWYWETRPHGERLVSAYWLCFGGLQIPARCFAMAWVAAGGWGRKFGLIALGLILIWLTNIEDVLYYFVWLGDYNIHENYFFCLRPDGFWNLWNILFLRVPIGVTVGVLLVRAGKCDIRSLFTTVLIWCAVLGIVLYALTFAFGRQFESYHNAALNKGSKPPAFVKLDAKLLDACIGEYVIAPDSVFYADGAKVTIRREGDHLVWQGVGRAALPGALDVYPESETNFFVKINGAQLTFIKNDKGEVMALIHHMAGLPDSEGKKLNNK